MGVRPSEALALRWKDVDSKQRKLIIGGSVGRHGEQQGTTKTAGSTRMVYLSL